MNDLESVKAMLDKAKQPYFSYCQIGEHGDGIYLVLDEDKDGGRYVPMLVFDLVTKNFIKAATRWIDP